MLIDNEVLNILFHYFFSNVLNFKKTITTCILIFNPVRKGTTGSSSDGGGHFRAAGLSLKRVEVISFEIKIMLAAIFFSFYFTD